MTNLLLVLPEFDIQPFTHILPSLEKALISTADLLTLDAFDVAKRAQVPPAEVKKLASALLDGLHAALSSSHGDGDAANGGNGAFQQRREESVTRQSKTISTLDDDLDAALCGGIAVGKLTEVVGESAAGKTQFLLTLLLSVQLPAPHGLGKSALYISTEAPLQTSRLSQILHAHPKLSTMPANERPSLGRIQSAHIHDLEAQDHILQYQVPVVIQRHDVGLLVVDSVAANYRPEFDKGKARRSAAESFVKRSNQVTQLGALLRSVATTYKVAVVVANQVADRFMTAETPSQMPMSQQTQETRPASPLQSNSTLSATVSQNLAPETVSAPALLSTDDPLALDHQQRFFTGWGDDQQITNLKTPSLGLAWTNQLAARIALLKVPVYEARQYELGEEPSIAGWKRTFKVVFSDWSPESSIQFNICAGGVQSSVQQRESGT